MSGTTHGVVVGVDGSDGATSAARWAAAVAVRLESPLHIVHAMPSIGHNLTDSAAALRAAVMSYQRDAAEIIVRSAVDAVREHQPDVIVTSESTQTPADEALIQLGRSSQMVVVGNSDVTAVGALILGSTTLTVATHTSCPVVAWRGSRTAPTNEPIVVGTDGARSSTAALATSFELADRLGAKLAVVRAWPILGPLAAVSNPLLVDWDALEAAEWAQLTDQVDTLAKDHQTVSASCSIANTRSTPALLHEVEALNAQMVVVGSRGRNALTSAVLGSTVVNLLHHSTVPVMVCRAIDPE